MGSKVQRFKGSRLSGVNNYELLMMNYWVLMMNYWVHFFKNAHSSFHFNLEPFNLELLNIEPIEPFELLILPAARWHTRPVLPGGQQSPSFRMWLL